MAEKSGSNEKLNLTKRRITLADGRYMIFYTFGESLSTEEENQKSEAEAAEEKNV